VRIGPDPCCVFVVAVVLEEPGGLDGLARIENVQVPDTAAEPDNLPAESLNGFDMLTLQIPENQGVDALGGKA
jgi:hypothetical protein